MAASTDTSQVGADVRRLAIEAVRRIDEDGAYANLALPSVLGGSDLDRRDRDLVTEIVYGATRMRAACDWLVDRFVVSPPPPALRAALRVGAYQLAFTRIPPHAAVSATVAAVGRRHRGAVNAILRRVAGDLPPTWPDEATRLSVPPWILATLCRDLGDDDAVAALETMNRPPSVVERDDGYVQDTASQWVVEAVDAQPGERVLDLCAAPGGKATAIAGSGARVVAADIRPGRVGLITTNARRVGAALTAVVADGTAPPFAPESFDTVLVDAPCSGLGVIRRRADARWRIAEADVARLAALQRELLTAAATLVVPGGRLVYSVCTLTNAETVEVADHFTASDEGAWVPDPIDDDRWRPHGAGALLLPQDHDTDGMAVFAWRRAAG